MFFIALTIVMVLAAAAVWVTIGGNGGPRPMPQPFVPQAQAQPQATSQASPAMRARSLRQQQLDEEAAAIADEYTQRADAAWRAELRAKASQMLDPSP